MATDYRELEARSAQIGAQVQELTNKAEITAEERDRVMSLTGEARAIDELARELRDAELAELREIADKGKEVGGESEQDAAAGEYRAWLRDGEARASLSATDANGGYIIPEPIHAALIEKVRKADPIFGNATVFNMVGDTVMNLPYKSAHGAVANAAETGARSEQNAPTFTSPTLTAYDYYTDQRATQQFLDSVAGSEDMLLGWIYEDIMEQAGADAVAGDGSTKIKGLFAETSTYTTKLSGSAGALVNTNFLTVYFALAAKYRANAKWVMAPGTLATVSAMTYPNLNDTPLVEFRNGVPYIMGKEVLESDSAPAVGAANFPVAFADIERAYAVGVHRNISVLRDPYTATPKVRFYGLGRLGGCAWDGQGAILLKSNNA